MLATPLSRLNISCSCTECDTFLRPLPKSSPSVHLPADLLPSTLGLGFSRPPTPAATPIPTRKCTPGTTPRLRPTAPTLAPSPAFLLTRSNSWGEASKEKLRGPLALPSLTLPSTVTKHVTFASRTLWAHMSSPIDEAKTPLTAKTPGLTTCAQEICSRKLVPGFGRTVCDPCEDRLRGAVLGLAAVMHDDILDKESKYANRPAEPRPRNDSGAFSSPEQDDKAVHDTPASEPDLFALPTTPATRLLHTHSLNSTPPRSTGTEHRDAEPALFALPNTSLDTSFEVFTPTATYVMNFPALPKNYAPNSAVCDKVAGGRTLKRSSRDVSELARSLSRNGRRGESKDGSRVGNKRNSSC